MKIAVDCRYLNRSGIGKYIEGILQELSQGTYDLLLIGKRKELEQYGFPILEDNSNPLSREGLTVNKESINECDAFFTPNYVIPSGIKTKIFTMIHDVIFLDSKDATNGFFDRMIKKHFIKKAIKKSEKVFTVSEFSKSRILKYKKTNKIVVAYPAITKQILEYNAEVKKGNYVLFVGNVKKNKGLDTLLGFVKICREMNRDIPVKIVGEYSNFRTSDSAMLDYARGYNVEFTGRVSDEDLCKLVSQAKFLIQPSRYEGFGVPPLEALYLKTKPVISDIEVFKEVYSGLDVEFFKVNDARDLYLKVTTSSQTVKEDQKEEILKRYNYKKTAQIIMSEIMK